MLSKTLLALALASVAFAQAQAPLWGQCGGQSWPGPLQCVAGAVCTYSNDWYSQCIPGPATSTVVTSSSSTSTSSTISAPTSTATTGIKYRLLPLGDSITFGLASSSGNGYRSTLHTLLEPGNTVDFIGSVKSGTMADNENEGHSGYTIDQIASSANASAALPSRPNIVLLMAGTNDAIGGNVSDAPTRLTNLINQVFTAVPNTALIVSTLIPLGANQAGVNTYNSAVTALVNNRTATGQHILLASMASILSSDLADGVHPNDAGYVKMANAWYPLILKAAANGWILPPA